MPRATCRRSGFPARLLAVSGLAILAVLAGLAPAAAVSDFEEVRLRFQSLDLDGNGIVNRDEIQRYARTKMTELDLDGDGFVNRADYSAYTQKTQRYDYTAFQLNHVSSRFMAAYDADFNQQVDIEEYQSLIEKSVYRWDNNKDGQVTFEEYLSQLGNVHAECYCGDY